MSIGTSNKSNVRLAVSVAGLAYSVEGYEQPEFGGYESNGVDTRFLAVQFGLYDRQRLDSFYMG